MVAADRDQTFPVYGKDGSKDPVFMVLHLPDRFAAPRVKYPHRLVRTTHGKIPVVGREGSAQEGVRTKFDRPKQFRTGNVPELYLAEARRRASHGNQNLAVL